jgi:hypothetical protein
MGIRGREGEGAQEKNEGEGDADEQKKMTKSGCKQKYARRPWRVLGIDKLYSLGAKGHNI